MEATAGGLTTGTLGSFTVVHGAATQISLTGAITNLTSGATRVLTATIQDAAGNTVTSDNTTVVTFAKQSGAGTVSGTGTATATAGVATKTITGVARRRRRHGGDRRRPHHRHPRLLHRRPRRRHPDLAHRRHTNLTSGATRVLTATIQDAAGNTVTSDNTTVVTFAKQSGAGTVTGTGTATAASGVATKTITGVLVGAVVDGGDGGRPTTGTLGSFTVVHGAATQISLTGAVTNLTSGATRVLTATIQDAAGNTVTSDNTTVVTFAKQSGAGTVTRHRHRHRRQRRRHQDDHRPLVGAVVMEATAGGLTTGTLGSFTVVHGAATQISLTGPTTNLTSGATRVLTATIQDAAGNTVTSDSTTVVTFAKQSGAGTVTGTGTATAASGVATKTITGALVGSVTMEATAAGLTTGTLGSFTVVHGAATQISLDGLDRQPHLRRNARPDRDDPGRRRQHRHLRQHDRRHLRQAVRRRHRHRHRHRHRRQRRRHQDDHRRARRLGDDGSHRGRPHHRHPRRLHRRPRRRHPDLADGRDHQPHLRRHARPDRDDPGRRRQHRHLRQHHRRRLRQGFRRRHRHRHRHRHRRERRRHQDDHRRSCRRRVMEATAGGLTTGTLGSFTVVHGAATQISLTGAPPTSPPAPPAS